MRIGLIGTGLMGLPMSHKILEAGFPLTVFNRSPAKADSLRDTEADLADSVGEVIDSSDCVILMLSDANAIDQVLFEEDLGSLIKTKCFLQMGTISPSETRKFQTKFSDLGGDYFEAPVLGSIPQVKSGELIVMAGGSEELRFPPFSGHLVKQLLGLRVVDWFRTLPGFGSQGLSGADRCCTG